MSKPSWTKEQQDYINRAIAGDIEAAKRFPVAQMIDMMIVMGGVIGFCLEHGLINKPEADFLLDQGPGDLQS